MIRNKNPVDGKRLLQKFLPLRIFLASRRKSGIPKKVARQAQKRGGDALKRRGHCHLLFWSQVLVALETWSAGKQTAKSDTSYFSFLTALAVAGRRACSRWSQPSAGPGCLIYRVAGPLSGACHH